MRTNSRLANDAWEALLTAHAVLIKELDAQDIWHGVSMREYDVLYTLAKCGEPIRPSELHRNVLLSQPALSRMVDRLVERGLVQRTKDPDDRRSVRLSLTELGAERQRSIGGRHAVGVARTVGSALDEDELRQLESLCRKLAQHGAGASVTDISSQHNTSQHKINQHKINAHKINEHKIRKAEGGIG